MKKEKNQNIDEILSELLGDWDDLPEIPDEENDQDPTEEGNDDWLTTAMEREETLQKLAMQQLNSRPDLPEFSDEKYTPEISDEENDEDPPQEGKYYEYWMGGSEMRSITVKLPDDEFEEE